MGRRSSRNRGTDYGTVILHWCLVIALAVAVLSGLRIASESPDHAWINSLDFILPRRFVWTAHVPAAIALIVIAIAYPVYVALAGLWRRVRFDRVRVIGLFGRRYARWGTINIALYWAFFLVLLSEIASGALMYFDYANGIIIKLHWLGTWLILGCAFAHMLVHWQIGGVPQLMRILRPKCLLPPPPPFDPIDLLELLDQSALQDRPPMQPRLAFEDADVTPRQFAKATDQFVPAPTAPLGARHHSVQLGGPRLARTPRRPRQSGPMLQSNPLVVALAVAFAGASLLLMAERQTSEVLWIRRVGPSNIPVIDGETSDRAWRMARPLYVLTSHGDNFDGRSETTVEIRAVHDSQWAYFLFTWDDPTRSLKQLPLVKRAGGWELLHEGYERGEEHAYNEDKFAVLLTKLDVILAGDRTFHAGAEPLEGKPRTLSGLGLHYTEQPRLFVDVWQWKATSTNVAGFMDDDYFGPPVEPTRAQVEGEIPYHGGFASDPGAASYMSNFAPHHPKAYGQVIVPRRLPIDAKRMMASMGKIDISPSHGESEGARWYMTDQESVPYSRELDAKIPVGTVVPGVIVSGTYSGDRADVRCAARWSAGRWALEVARRLNTGSLYDVPISSGTFMRVAAFDHTQIGHTRHVRPIRLEVE